MSRLAACAALLLIAADPGESWKYRKCCDKNVPRAWASYNRVGTVFWTQPYEAAVAKAREKRKLLMVFQLVGDMDKEGC
ncbi:MAG TPA: hypothetical protein VFS19_05275 [Planctomycetota bacterium]|nr:hypothetical protein [Planctomycetota bacterium]